MSSFLISADRLSDFNISVGGSFKPGNKDLFDPSTFTQCAHVPGQLGAGETRVIQCKHPIRGRYVTVNLNQQNYLTICEFQVHGTPVLGEFIYYVIDKDRCRVNY